MCPCVCPFSSHFRILRKIVLRRYHTFTTASIRMSVSGFCTILFMQLREFIVPPRKTMQLIYGDQFPKVLVTYLSETLTGCEPGVVPACSAFGRSFVFFKMSLNCLSTRKNAFASVGSCRWMSGAEKMLSKYIQFFWQFIHSSRVSENRFNCFSVFSTSDRMPPINLNIKEWAAITLAQNIKHKRW